MAVEFVVEFVHFRKKENTILVVTHCKQFSLLKKMIMKTGCI